MCGIYGFVGIEEPGLLERMGRVLRHRGPDEEGDWSSPEASLGIQRLSIIDPETGQQPFADEEDRLRLVANGEVYNQAELREELSARGHRFRSRSDCEVLVHLFEERGAEMLPRLNGMFALAVWDREERRLTLARDRFGIRPLYYVQCGDGLIFASETKALLESGRVDRELDRGAVDEYLALRYAVGPGTFFRAIKRLPPGHLLTWRNGRVEVSRWYEPIRTVGAGGREGLEDRVDEVLRDSIRLRLLSDVPVGVFLSGGIDSGIVTTLVKEAGAHPVRTFSIGFGRSDDELERARRIAAGLGTEHHEATLRPEDLRALPRIVWHLDEPVGDSIVVPTYHLARAASGTVKVVLTGEGADELFGGYVHHRSIQRLEAMLRLVPTGVTTSLLAAGARAVPVSLLERFVHYPGSVGVEGRARLAAYLGDRAASGRAAGHFATLFSFADREALYGDQWRDARAHVGPYADLTGEGDTLVEQILDRELTTWLPDYTLHKQDRLLMACSIEGRVPYLDHRLVDLVHPLPLSDKLRGGIDKLLLRRVAARHVGGELSGRRKQAFFLPLVGGYHEVMLEMAAGLLGDDAVRRRGMFRPEAVRVIREQARGASLVSTKKLMALVILEIWMRLFVDGDRTLLARAGEGPENAG